MIRRPTWIPGFVLAAALVAALPAQADTFEDLASQVHEFTLENGLTFILFERHDAPVFSFRTYVDAGGVDEVPGVTGIAHMFEHMAFKGTQTIGTTDYAAEQKALQAVDEAWMALAREQAKGFQADENKVAQLETAFKEAQTKAQEYVVSNEFSKVLEENGAQGLNAATGTDMTFYLYNLPSNRLELWARLEGDRLTQPVLREFYTERDVVIEERRFQESSPSGRLFDALMTTGFIAHPYGTGIIGYASDLEQLTRQDAWDFFETYYVASNMTIAVVGDVYPADLEKLARKYFSKVPAGDDPLPVRTVEPKHEAEIRFERVEDAQPMVGLGYHIPGMSHPKWYAYELLGDILGSGRSSRLYTTLVKEEKIASQAGGGSGFPGRKYPSMLILFALVSTDSTPHEVEAAMKREAMRLLEEGPTEEELEKVKSMNKASLLRQMRSNSGLAGMLAQYQGMFGDWRELFEVVQRIDAVTLDDVREAAAETLRPGNAVVGLIKKPEGSAS